MSHTLAALLLDLGDTIMLEETEVKDDQGTTLRAELIPGMAEALRQLKTTGHRLALVADARLTHRLTFSANMAWLISLMRSLSLKSSARASPTRASFARRWMRWALRRATTTVWRWSATTWSVTSWALTGSA
jgi:hypothetical protein